MPSNQFMDALAEAESLQVRKEEFSYELNQFMKRLAAYESELQEFKHSGKATTSVLEDLINRRSSLMDEQALLQELEAELNTDIKRYQDMRKSVE